MKKSFFIFFAILATAVGFYPSIYFLIDRKFGLLQSKSAALLVNPLWNIQFYIHIILGGIALLIGWIQFLKPQGVVGKFHKQVGKIYVISALLSALSGIYIASFATGGLVAALGFLCLGVLWFYFTLQAFLKVREMNFTRHAELMTYSYACCFAAVTLRIWLPLLIYYFDEFNKAYVIVAWLCWIPNLIVAFLLIKLKKKQSI